MAKLIQSSGQYNVKDTGEVVSFEFEYSQFENLDDAIAVLRADKALSMLQRMEKVDAGNTAREKAKSANGHSTTKKMTEAEKAEKKQERQADKQLLRALKKNPELLAQLGI